MQRPARETLKTSQSGQLEIFVIIIVVVAAAAYALYSQKLIPQIKAPPTEPTTATTPTPTPTPTALTHGKATYKVSQGPAFIGPKTSNIVVDPLDPQTGEKQTVTVTIAYTSAVDSVMINLISDNKSRTYPLQLVSGTNQNGDWQGSWTVDDTYWYTYIMEITAKSGGTGTPIVLGIRQPPTPTK